MARAQASRGGVGLAHQDFSSAIRAYADAVLSFAERELAWLPERRAFDLPGVSVDIGFSAPDYAALCDRAYVSEPRRGDDTREATLVVLDLAHMPGLPRWTRPSPGLGNVTIALAEAGLRGAYDTEHDIWTIYDPVKGLGVQAMRDVSLRPPWEASFPLRLLLHWASRGDDRGMVHAGTLGRDGRGVFLVGAGGSGKSGTTLAGILHGLTSAGDDYVAISVAKGHVEACPVLRLMKQDIGGLRRVGLKAGDGRLAGPLNWQGKIELDFAALRPGARAERLDMIAILLPRIARASASTFRAASPRQAMMAMAPSSLFQLYGSWREDFGLMATVARMLPAFHLDLGDDPAEIADAIRGFIVERTA